MRSLSTIVSMKAFAAVFALTINDESKYVSAAEIAKFAGLSEDDVLKQLENSLAEYLSIQNKEQTLSYRISGRYMHIMPLLMMICNP